MPADLVEAAKRREDRQRGVAEELHLRVSPWHGRRRWRSRGAQSPEDDVEAIRRVTVADVNRVARQYLDLDHAIAAILTPQPSGQAGLHQRLWRQGVVYARANQRRQAAARGRSKPSTGWRFPPPRLNPVVTNLPNGLKLIVQPETISDTVSVYGRVKKSNSDRPRAGPPGRTGWTRSLDQLLSYRHDVAGPPRLPEGAGRHRGERPAGTDFSLQVLPEHFERGVQLLADNELLAGVAGGRFKIIQPQLAAAWPGRCKSPDYLAAGRCRRRCSPSA